MNFLFLLESTAAADAKGGSSFFLILIYAAFFLFMWFVLIRPQRKKQKEVARMQSEIKLGDSILTSGGLYGTVVDSVNDVLIIEFGMNKGVRVPVQRHAVTSVAQPDLTVVKEVKEIKEEPAKDSK